MTSLVGMRILAQQQDATMLAMERLATGKRINRASDDPSGLIAANSFAARGAAITKEIERLEFASFRASVQEGAYSVVSDMFIELDALVVAAANTGGLSEGEREAMQIEADGIIEAIEHIYGTSRFNGELMFEPGAFQGLGSTQIASQPVDAGSEGAGSGGGPAPEPSWVHVNLDSIKGGGALNLVDGNLEEAQSMVRSLSGSVSATRAGIGLQQTHYYDKQIHSLQIELESITAGESAIRDTNVALEVANLVRSQVLAEVAMRAIMISRDAAKNALTLLG